MFETMQNYWKFFTVLAVGVVTGYTVRVCYDKHKNDQKKKDVEKKED